MIQFRCPHCRQLYEVKDDVAGKKTKCRNCKQTFTVPVAAAEPSPPPSKPASPPSTSAPAPSNPAPPPPPVPSTPAPPVSTSPAAPPPDHGPADVEALAAAALADEPAPAASPEPTT